MIQDDAQKWYETQGAEIQDYEVPENPLETPVEPPLDYTAEGSAVEETFDDTITKNDIRQQANIMEFNRPISETIVFVMDALVPMLVVLVLKGADKDDLKLTPQEQEQLVKAWALYLGNKEVSVSPGMALIVTILTIYSSKVMIAYANRKDAEEKERLLQELQRLTAETAQHQQASRQREQELLDEIARMKSDQQ